MIKLTWTKRDAATEASEPNLFRDREIEYSRSLRIENSVVLSKSQYGSLKSCCPQEFI